MITYIVVTTIIIVIPIISGMQQLNVLKVYYITNQFCTNIYFIANHSCISGSLSLVDSFLKICAFGQWYTLCSNTWTLGQAKVACRQLGRNPLGMIVTVLRLVIILKIMLYI